jgi:hypothetical protein
MNFNGFLENEWDGLLHLKPTSEQGRLEETPSGLCFHRNSQWVQACSLMDLVN